MDTEETDITTPTPPAELACAIELQYSDRVNFAIQQNGVPLVDRVTLTSSHDDVLEDLTIELSLDNDEAEPWTARLARLDPGSSATLSAEDFSLSVRQLATRTEAQRAKVVAKVSCASGQARSAEPVDLLAFDQWPGVGYFAELTAAFVTPNHPKVAELLQAARQSLGNLSETDALDGYQSKSRQRASHLAEACFNSLAAQGIGYINPPASFETTGQRVRLIDRVMREKLGTCLDLTLGLMSLWEQCGMHPLILLTQGHAMPAVWTHDTHLSQTVIDEPARIRNLIELGEVLPVESTHLTQAGASFAGAVEAAKRTMQTPGDTFHAIDIRSARKRGVRPLPLRADGEAGVDLDAIEFIAPSTSSSSIHSIALADRAEAWSQEQNAALRDPDMTPEARVTRWQKRLLDLSLRNRLLNFKETGRTLPLDVPDLAVLENLLAEGQAFDVLPKLDDNEQFLQEELSDRRLHAQATDAESKKRLLNLYRTAKSSIEETGANILYLALGLLKWYEHDAADQPRYAPLLLLPITLHRESTGGSYAYRIELNDEPLYPNVTLLEKLRTEFGINAPQLDDLPEDENGLDIELIFRNFRHAIRDNDMVCIMALTVIFNIWVFPYVSMIPVVGEEDLGLSASVIGYVTAIEGAAGLCMIVAIGLLARQRSFRVLYAFGVGATMAAVGFIGTVETLSGLIIGLILAGSSIAFFASMQSTLVYRAAPHEMRGRYLGLISLCIGTGLIGFANIGITAEYFGAANAMWIIAAEGALPFLIVVLCWRGLHSDLGFRVRTA